jgi:membrane-associated phospholipid phosphatase
MHASIGAGFLIGGTMSDNDYHFNTGIMLWHGMVTSTIYNQILKRSFGRESPEVSTSKRGSWHMFPSFNEYNSRTASYDAMPTGHVMTATMTFTILAERYPDHTNIIYPLGGVWISALMFQMMNNGVHWASDYPLGIGMGYVFGKAATKIVKKDSKDKESETAWNFMPMMNGTTGMLATRKF